MKRLLLVLALLLTAEAAHAQARLAVILDTRSSAQEREICMTVLRRSGPPFDVFNVTARTWGETSKADSTWFRERYAAVLIPWVNAGSGFQSTAWSTNFLDESGGAGISRGPFSGRWSIPVVALTRLAIFSSTDGPGDTVGGNGFASGIRGTPGFTVNKPSVDTIGTWRYRTITRIGGGIDTLYTDPVVFGCSPSSWGGAGTKAVLAWVDTVASAGGCQSQNGDTLAAVWRWRPHNGKPGIVWSTLHMQSQAGAGTNHGILIALQYLYTVTAIRPFDRIAIPIMPHNSYGTSATGKTIVRQTHEAMIKGGVRFTATLPQSAPDDFVGPHDADTRAELRRVSNQFARWAPGTNAGGLTLAFYAASETVGVRRGFNAAMNTAGHKDSFALPRKQMQLSRFVSSGGVVGNWQLKVLADAGVQLIESTVTTPQSAGWTVLNPPGAFYMPHPHTVPGGETRQVWSSGTVQYPADAATYSVLKGTQADHEFFGSIAAAFFCAATQNPVSLYWHASTNSAGDDPYMAWFMARLASDFRLFNKVVKPADGEVQVRLPRRR